MNCKPGDLAVIFKSRTHPRLIGLVVHVLYAGSIPGSWIVEGAKIEEIARIFGIPPQLRDECLRPIRDNDGEDETLQWAGKPESINA